MAVRQGKNSASKKSATNKKSAVQTVLRARAKFSLPSVVILVCILSIIGFFIIKTFAATPAAYPCNSPFPTIQSGARDTSGGRTDKCVTAIQQIFYVKTSYRLVRTGVVDAPTLEAIKAFQAMNKVAQTGVLSPKVVAGIPAYFGYSGYAIQATNPPPPPPPPAGCEETDTCEIVEPPVEPPTGGNPVVSVESLPDISGDVNLDQLSTASPDELQQIIDDSISTDTDSAGSENVLRSYSGRLRILPPQQDIDDGATQFKYYINAKLKATAKKKPYAYVIDTTRVKNGRYALTIVSFVGTDKLYEHTYVVTTKNTLTFWQKLFNFITSPFAR